MIQWCQCQHGVTVATEHSKCFDSKGRAGSTPAAGTALCAKRKESYDYSRNHPTDLGSAWFDRRSAIDSNWPCADRHWSDPELHPHWWTKLSGLVTRQPGKTGNMWVTGFDLARKTKQQSVVVGSTLKADKK